MYQRTKLACYATNLSMSAACNLSPLLFVTFREMYGISYTLLGFLVVVNYSTQLLIDLVFTFFERRFNIAAAVRVTPVVALFGLLFYAVMPSLFPQSAYLWLVLGTVIFSVAMGLCEVLISPVIAAIPAENPEREMSKLHAVYAWGVVGVVVISTLFLLIVGNENWRYLALFWCLLPLAASILFARAPLPPMEHGTTDGQGATKMSAGILLCAACIFLGGASECTMAQWVSGYIENALAIPKVVGDIAGVALFAVMMGIGRTMYSKVGKNISRVMLLGMAGAFVCYLVASLCGNPIVCLVGCVMCGICVAMLWPGTLIWMGEQFPTAGVAAYALMAAGGDFGASVAPQLVGVLADTVANSTVAQTLATTLSLSTEQIGIRAGMLTASVFPLLGTILVLCMRRYFKKRT